MTTLHQYAGQNIELETLRILREIRKSTPWMPQVPDEDELQGQIEVIDNDQDCIKNGYRL